MKLAELLAERTNMKSRISSIRSRMYDSVKYQEGNKPVDSEEELMGQLRSATKALHFLICLINKTNQTAQCDGRVLADMLAERAAKSLELTIYRDFLNHASDLTDRYGKSEIVKFSSVEVVPLRAEIDRKAKALRLLDLKIQALNWAAEVPGYEGQPRSVLNLESF